MQSDSLPSNNLNLERSLDAIARAIVTMGLNPPSGSVVEYAGAVTTIPSGWLLCDGSAVSRTIYAGLYASLGVVYGAGDGSTTFNLPDMRGRVPVGVGTATGAAGATAHTLGQKSGEETHQLSTAEIPSHQHQLDRTNGAYGASTASMGYGGNVALSPGASGDLSVYTSATGGSGAHNNMQPYIGMNFIVKT